MASNLKTRVQDVVGVGDITPGEQLRALRELMCMTQKQLEAASKVKQIDISAIERDRKMMNLTMARKLARGLGVPLSILLDEDTADSDPVALILNAVEELGAKSDAFLIDLARLTEQLVNLDKGKEVVIHRRGAGIRYSVQPR